MKTNIEELARKYSSWNDERIAFTAGYQAAIESARDGVYEYKNRSNSLTEQERDEFFKLNQTQRIDFAIEKTWQAAKLSSAKEIAELREENKILLEAVESKCGCHNTCSICDSVFEQALKESKRLKEKYE